LRVAPMPFVLSVWTLDVIADETRALATGI
jgi:hypothetical protein